MQTQQREGRRGKTAMEGGAFVQSALTSDSLMYSHLRQAELFQPTPLCALLES